MRGYNKTMLIGNLGKEPIVQTLEGSVKVAKLVLATTESYRDKNGMLQTETDWHNIVLWRGLAELAEKYLRTGSLIMVEGKLKSRKYDDKEGVTRYVTEVIGENLLMLDKRQNDDDR